jgi:hypothetical protein
MTSAADAPNSVDGTRRTTSRTSSAPASPTCLLPGCDLPVPPERVSKGGKYCSFDHKTEAENARKRGVRLQTPTTRRCRSKLCIERFVPTNKTNWYHEPACSLVPDDMKWTVEDILNEEGSLLPGGNHLEMAKAAFGQKNTALRENSRLRSLREYLTFEIQSFHDEHPEYRYPQVPKVVTPKSTKKPREIIIQTSDWQIGKWEAGFGWKETEKRIDALKVAIAEIIQRQREAGFPVRTARISEGGDGLEGCYIYRGQNVTGLDKSSNTHRLTVQARTLAQKRAELAIWVASLVDEVEVETVGGNHGRPNGPNDYADPEDNFDVMAAWWAEDICRNNPRIKWHTSENWWHSYESMGHKIVSMHGDQWNGPLERLETLLPQWIASGVFGSKPEMVLTHHRHSRRELEIAGIPVIQNGTIDGGSGWYLRAFGKASRPAQNIIVVSERHLYESIFPVWFSSQPSGALVA